MTETPGPICHLGIDTGGTFTDYIAQRSDGSYRTGKVPSTPEDPSRSISRVLDRLDVYPEADFVHGTTVATNALLEDQIADVALVTNRGLDGLLAIGRGTRRRLYELNPDPGQYVFRNWPVVEVPLRQHPRGRDATGLNPSEAEGLRRRLDQLNPDVVAVCLVHSYRDDAGERAVRSALESAPFEVVLSSEVLPRFREFERASTTCVNAALTPVVSRYIENIRSIDSAPEQLLVMGSDRGATDAEETVRRPVNTVLSGPAAGMLAARDFGSRVGEERILSIDIGGTSTDVSLIEDTIPLRDDHEVGGYPIAQPMVDLHTVGSGGGSVLWSDRGGHLRVGPRSAGARPGPACYGRGGPPTVTDAQLLLGRIPPDRSLSEELELSLPPARSALGTLGDELAMSALEVARGALSIVHAQLAEAVRAVTLKRGVQPSRFPLVAFGGGGGLYAARLADELDLPGVFVPRKAGVASAWGLLEAPRVVQRSVSPMTELGSSGASLPGASRLREKRPGWADSATEVQLEAECQFSGQTHTLRVPVEWDTGEASLADAFRGKYDQTYGYVPSGAGVQLVHLQVFWRRAPSIPDRTPGDSSGEAPLSHRTLRTSEDCREVPVYCLESVAGRRGGPCLFSGGTTTVYCPPGWIGRPHPHLLELVRDG